MKDIYNVRIYDVIVILTVQNEIKFR